MVESDYQPVTNARAYCEQIGAKFYRLSPHMKEMVVELDEQNCELLVDLLIETKLYMLQSSSILDDINRYTAVWFWLSLIFVWFCMHMKRHVQAIWFITTLQKECWIYWIAQHTSVLKNCKDVDIKGSFHVQQKIIHTPQMIYKFL